LQSPRTRADAGDQHFLLVADAGVKLSFRDPRARRDLQRTGCGKAILHKRREGRLEDARTNGGPVAALVTRICERRRHFHLLEIGTNWYQFYPTMRYRPVPKMVLYRTSKRKLLIPTAAAI